MFQLGLINSIFWCIGLACLISMILLAIKGKKPFFTVLTVLFGIVFTFNLSLAVDAKWISLVFNSSAKDWTKTHDYIFYSLVLIDVICAICLLFAKSSKINDKLWKCFAIVNVVTTIACNVYNYYTGIVNYKLIQALTNDVPALLATISNIVLYARFVLTLGFGVGLLFAKVKDQPQEEVAPETVRPELELITEVDVKPATELATASDTQEQVDVSEETQQIDVVEEKIEEETTAVILPQEEPTEEIQEDIVKEETIEQAIEVMQEDAVEEDTAIMQEQEETTEETLEELAEATVDKQELVDQPTEKTSEETTTEQQEPINEQIIEETVKQQEITETTEQQQESAQPAMPVMPTAAKDKPKKKLSKSKPRLRPTRKFINYIRHSKVEIQIPNMICKNCGTKTHSESKICPRCFHKMVPLYKCPQCDTLNETRVCSNCGAKIGKR